MTQEYEFNQVSDEPQREKRPATDFIPWMRCTETPNRPGKLLIVRPLEAIDDYRPLPEGADPNKWRGKLIRVDVACLDAIPSAVTELGEELPGFPPGTIFRWNTVKLGYLNKAFGQHIGGMVIGTVYPKPTVYAKPAVHWRDLFADESAKARARSFFQAFPQFFTRVPDPYEEFQRANNPQPAPAATAAPAANGWNQTPDPWAQAPAQGVAPAQAQDPRVGLSALEQMRQAAATGAQGEPPF